VTEAIPLFVTSLMIPVVLVFSGIANAVDATAPFFNPIIVLFFAGFLMAEAMQRCGLDHYIAVSITARSGRNAATLFGAMLVLTAVLSMFMSNTAAAALLVPIAIAVTAPLGDVNFRKALVLGIAYASTIGGVGSAIGTPANQIAIEFLEGFGGRSISFVEWFAFGLPMVVLFVPIMAVYLWKRSRIHVEPERFVEARRVAVDEHRKLGKPDHDQMIVLAVLLAVVAGWLTQTFHGFHAGIVALAGAVALFILGKLLPEDLGRISWPSLLTFGGGLTLGLFLVRSGTSDYLATRLVGLANVPEVIAVLAVASLTLLLTTVASNTASAAILIPLAIPLAGVLGVSPIGLVMVVAVASSIDFALVVGTPPTMIAYSTRLYTAGQIFRRGIVLDLVGIVLLVFVVTRIWELFGLV
ncbi:MAG: SLC13 family permease, partial [Acidimicrobiia bacterium]